MRLISFQRLLKNRTLNITLKWNTQDKVIDNWF